MIVKKRANLWYSSFFCAMMIEICAANLESALIADQSGADRIELCSALDVGGLTPSAGLIQLVLKHLTIPVCVLIRPREGHFCYSKVEIDAMVYDIEACSDWGVQGVVVGAAMADGRIDWHSMRDMSQAAGAMSKVCHRVFDFCPDPFEAVDRLVDLGFDRILTSGQATNAMAGATMIRQLIEYADGRIVVMPGGGVSPANIADIVGSTGAKEIHLSARKMTDLPAGHVPIPGLDQAYYVSDPSIIAAIRAAVTHL